MAVRTKAFSRIPAHIGVIPDGNRRWAQEKGLSKEYGYKYGLKPGMDLYDICKDLGIGEITYYGFTQDNTKRPKEQRIAFQEACVEAVEMLLKRDADLLVVGNTGSPMFPKELLPYTKQRTKIGKGLIKVNFLVNYSWQWDLLQGLLQSSKRGKENTKDIIRSLGSSQISRIDLIVRWGGRRRLSGFLPVQTIYSDFYIIDDLWPDFTSQHVMDALTWYQKQDITLGG